MEGLGEDRKILGRIKCVCGEDVTFETRPSDVEGHYAVVKTYHLGIRVCDYFVNPTRELTEAETAAEILLRSGKRVDEIRNFPGKDGIFRQKGCGIRWYLTGVEALRSLGGLYG